MLKSQKTNIILCLVFFSTFIIPYHSGFCEAMQDDLYRADSLFEAKKYVQSLKIYEDIRQQGYASPAMLLKMAYINEAVDDIPGTLYYLNLYYGITFNKKALKKMEGLADTYDLSGYNYNDLVFFKNIFANYKLHVTGVLLGGIFLIFGYMIYRIRRQKVVSNSYKALWFTAVVTLLLILNLDLDPDYGILKNKQIYIMSAPSSGAPLMEIAKGGHRVKVQGKKDVWVKISWNGSHGFVKQHHLKLI